MRGFKSIWFVSVVLCGIAGCGDEAGSADDDGGGAGAAGSQFAAGEGGAGGAGGGGAGGAGGGGAGGAGGGGAGGAGGGGAGGAGGGGAGGAGGEEVPPVLSDECGLDTGFPGDEYCILPPPPDKGFQIHIGPDDYDNIEAKYMLGAMKEATTDFPAVSSNDADRFFYRRQYRMRPGSHHMILTDGSGSGLDMGHRIATANHSGDYPASGDIAPENEGVGIAIGPKSNINVSLHSINVTDQPILREIWVNFWYRDAADVTEPAIQWFKTGSVTFAIAPGDDTILGPFSCNITQPGRLLWLYGHRHANNVRFSTWRVRGGQRDLIYEGLFWEEPIVLEYSSDVTNAVPDRDADKEGGWSGILDLMPGDRIEWECHIINTRSGTLRFTNNTFDGEMCIVDAEAVGSTCM